MSLMRFDLGQTLCTHLTRHDIPYSFSASPYERYADKLLPD